jgi:hypothetical protein
MARVPVTVEETTLENDDGVEVEGVVVTCERCGESVEIFGRSGASIKRGCATLHESCDQNNFYTYD